MRSTLKTLAAMALWAALHSLLATKTSKRAAEKLLGTDRKRGFYRIGYNGIAVLTTLALAAYLRRLPDHHFYKARGITRISLGALRLILLLIMVRAALEIGIGPFSGISELLRYLLGRRMPNAPEAQGPSLGTSGLRTGGPFRYARHPLNAAATAYIFLTPRMTEVRLTVALTTLLYAILGSKLEERRLLETYGDPYRRYLLSGVPFFLPRLSRPVAKRFSPAPHDA